MTPAPLKYLLLSSLIITLSACSGLSAPRAADAPPAQGGQAETYENPNYYYLFDDILIPNGMEHATDDDFSFDTQQFKAGIQIFQGRVVFDDLINFFQNNMIKDGWRKVSSVRSKKSILVFEKANKAAIIELEDGFKAKATVFALEYKAGSSATSTRTQLRPGTARGPAASSAASRDSFTEKDISN
ncbi:MAG: hypothetical protein AUJ49_02645 [Desulfovibrionaceae bacterium CG1_02_65_16]|nr:MAG: hypothetical protein AUJ49_02645 [Desulfovibrionaceae bacterium CG1_02_65_16]